MKLAAQSKYILKNLKDKVKIIDDIKFDNLIIYANKENLIETLNFLKKDKELQFKILLDLFGADFLGKKTPRFEVIYNLLSLKLNSRLTLKVALADNEAIESADKVFNSANWYEREIFDMYGIIFENSRDLRRILTDYGFEGYPLSKDFPLTGYKEVRYDDEKQKVVYQDVELMQEFRNFDFTTPWQGTDYKLPGDEKAD